MRISIDRDACIGAGQCVMAAGEVFDQSEDDGRVLLLQETPGEESRAAVEEAADVCPTAAITVHDD